MNQESDLHEWIQAEAERVETYLEALLPPESTSPERLHAAMRYAVLGGGKRLRPVLTALAFHAAGGRGDGCRAAQAAIELVHAFSLVHDDLPCLDDDAIRRGRPTVHKVFGEAHALLAGDALLALGFEVLGAADHAGLMLAELGRGARGMIAGQAMEEEAAGAASDIRLEDVHALKTGRLFEASMALGGLAVQATPGVLDHLRGFGRQFGLAFQVADDLLDHGESGSTTYARNPSLAARTLDDAANAAAGHAGAVGGSAPWSGYLVGLSEWVRQRGVQALKKLSPPSSLSC